MYGDSLTRSSCCLRAPLILLGLIFMVGSSVAIEGDRRDQARRLLFHPVWEIEEKGDTLLFHSAAVTFLFDQKSWEWTTRKREVSEHRERIREVMVDGVPWGIADTLIGGRALIRIDPGSPDPLDRIEVVVWNPDRLGEVWLGHEPSGDSHLFEKDYVGWPSLNDVARDGGILWLTVGYYGGEGFAGIGTILRVDTASRAVELLQPKEIAQVSVGPLAVTRDALWVGTRISGEFCIYPGNGLVRIEFGTKRVSTFTAKNSPLLGGVITALHVAGEALWIATDAGICRYSLTTWDWVCWRMVPAIYLPEATAISSSPGGLSRGELSSGSHEVRWAEDDWYQVATEDSVEGWVDPGHWHELTDAGFWSEPYWFWGNISAGPDPVSLMDSTSWQSTTEAVVYRTPLQLTGVTSENGWPRARTRAGWVPAGAGSFGLCMWRVRNR